MLRLPAILLFLVAFAAAAPCEAQATGADQTAAICDQAIVAGARRGGVPTEALQAIALTETGRNLGGRMRAWPWAINREGEGHWFASRDEALAFAKASLAAGRTSFDVGCFQINYRWHGHAFNSLEAMFDQDVNGTYAAQFLRSLHEELGSWSAAAGAYHSRTPEFANRYRARYDSILAGIGGAPLVVAAAGPQDAGADPAEPQPGRKRKLVRPKIINLAGRLGTTDPAPSRIAHIRVERGSVPASVRAAMAQTEAAAGDEPVVISSRNAPF